MPKVQYDDQIIEVTEEEFNQLDRHKHLAHFRGIIPTRVIDRPWVSLAEDLETSVATVDRFYNEHPED